MNRWISERLAQNAMMSIFSAMIIFHLLILSGVIPFDIVWGGRLNTREEMIRFETISIATQILMLLVVALRARVIKVGVPPFILTIALWP